MDGFRCSLSAPLVVILYTIQFTSPEEGLENIVDPENKTASPAVGPHVKGTDNKATSGQLDEARANAFFVANNLHDVAYLYGFNDALGIDNADMTTPADGSPGKMRMFLWDITNPERDGALENDIALHEYAHGITDRLTGGDTGECLQSDEAGGMGEGWSDSIAFWMQQTADTVSNYTMGSFVVNDAKGIHSHPYSTSKTVSPYTSGPTLLINVYAALVGTSGFNFKAYSDASWMTGNAVWLPLFIDALAFQPCTPTFITAHDAWIQADKNRYNGANARTLCGRLSLGVDPCSGSDSGTGTGEPPAPTETTTTTSDESEPTAPTTTTTTDELRRLKLPTRPTRRTPQIPRTQRPPRTRPTPRTHKTPPSAPTGGASSNA
ncbi:Fungalysin metallopeptidase-domain-containing protein [Auriculariales sp. MPI-PUGE-AT-0066]|nr:Fungalysin metallopeptidase-domain-containing protein [Auriculariales sp. MPI-PUGE-AT-0066]